MVKVYQLTSVQRVPASLDKVWDFFSDPRNLFAITPPFLNLVVTNQPFGGRMYAGQVITYKVKPLLGVPLFWMTEITHVQEGKLFVDEQRQGPYKLWHHQHHFVPIEGGVEMTDIVHYAVPFGPLGRLANAITIKGQLHKIFTYRYQKIVELFGPWPGDQKMELIIE